jgi:hypothetical protein
MYNEDAPTTIAPAMTPCKRSLIIIIPLIKVDINNAPTAPDPKPAIMQSGLV